MHLWLVSVYVTRGVGGLSPFHFCAMVEMRKLSNKSRDRGSGNAWQQVAAAGPHLKPQVFGKG